MSHNERSPSLFWGLIPLAAVPLSGLMLASYPRVMTPWGERSSAVETLLEILRYDWLVPPSLIISLLACAHVSRVVTLSLRDGRVPGSLALVPLLIPSALVFGLIDHQLSGLLKASTHCGPMPWERVLVIEAGGFLLLRAAVLVLAGCSALCVGVALLPTLKAPERAARFGFLLAIAGIGACFLVSANAAMGARAAMIADALADTSQSSLVLRAIERWREVSQASNTLLLSALVLGVGAALRLANRGEAQAGIGGFSMLAIVAMGLRSAGALDDQWVHQRLADSYYFRAPAPPESGLSLTSRSLEVHKQIIESRSYGYVQPRASFLLDRSDNTRTLQKMLATSRAEGAAMVHLAEPLEPLAAPVIFAPSTLLQKTRVDTAWMGLRFDDEPSCARSAVVVGDALHVSADGKPMARWVLSKASPVDVFTASAFPCVALRIDPTVPPSSLLAAASAALDNGHWPMVEVPRRRGWPVRDH